MATEPVVLSHWFRLIEDFDSSSLDLYSAVGEAVDGRQLPETIHSRVDFFEAGPLSAKREYLRVRRDRLVFDIGAGPFGTGFFISWWMGELRSGPWKLLLILLALGVLTWVAFAVGLIVGSLFFLLGIPLILIYLAREAPPDLVGWDDPIIATPFVGRIYQNWFKPETRYRADTRIAFQQSVHSAILEVLDQHMTAKGLRALSELERQPTLRDAMKL